MLVITRHETESVVLRDRETNNVLGTVTLMGLKGDRARIGFQFPLDVVVDRKEIDDQKNPTVAEGASA